MLTVIVILYGKEVTRKIITSDNKWQDGRAWVADNGYNHPKYEVVVMGD